jgi:hypothetical protein
VAHSSTSLFRLTPRARAKSLSRWCAGVCAELLEDVLLHHDLVISDFILEELSRKLVEKFNFPSATRISSAPPFVELALLFNPPICRWICAEIPLMCQYWARRLPAAARYSSASIATFSICKRFRIFRLFAQVSIGDADRRSI